jgi:hypothetical protein
LVRCAQRLISANVLEDSGGMIVTFRGHHASIRSRRKPVGLWSPRAALPPLRRSHPQARSGP